MTTLAKQVARIRPGDTVTVLVRHPDDDEPVPVGPCGGHHDTPRERRACDDGGLS